MKSNISKNQKECIVYIFGRNVLGLISINIHRQKKKEL